MKWYLRAGFAVSMVFGVGALLHAWTPVIVQIAPASLYEPNRDAITEQHGWPQIGDEVRKAAATLGPDAVIASTQYALCAHLLDTVGDSPPVYCPSARRTQFDFLEGGRHTPPAEVPVVYVNNNHYSHAPEELVPGRACDGPSVVEITRGARLVQQYRIWACNRVEPPDSPRSP